MTRPASFHLARLVRREWPKIVASLALVAAGAGVGYVFDRVAFETRTASRLERAEQSVADNAEEIKALAGRVDDRLGELIGKMDTLTERFFEFARAPRYTADHAADDLGHRDLRLRLADERARRIEDDISRLRETVGDTRDDVTRISGIVQGLQSARRVPAEGPPEPKPERGHDRDQDRGGAP